MKLGFIGTGNMASAIIGGVIKSGVCKPEEITGSDPFAPSRDKVKETFGINVTADNRDVVKNSDVFFLSVKPQQSEEVISEIKDIVTKDQVIVSIAPGKTLDWMKEKFGREVKLVRVMPNTPALVGEGMSAACPNHNITDDDMAKVKAVLESVGVVEIITAEKLMDTVTAISGASPAYVDIFIEAMADGAVYCGMPRAQAYRIATQAVLGSAKLVQETGKHPGELKDNVCSPAGTTIAAVRILEEGAFRATVMNAVIECEDVSRNL